MSKSGLIVYIVWNVAPRRSQAARCDCCRPHNVHDSRAHSSESWLRAGLHIQSSAHWSLSSPPRLRLSFGRKSVKLSRTRTSDLPKHLENQTFKLKLSILGIGERNASTLMAFSAAIASNRNAAPFKSFSIRKLSRSNRNNETDKWCSSDQC